MKRLFTFIAGLFMAGSALADLTVSQMQTLKTLAAADPVAVTYLDGNHDEQLGQWFSASTAFVVWRSVLTTAKTVNNGDAAPSFAAGALTFQIDN